MHATDGSTRCLAGESSGINYPLTETRGRQFGGSSALWSGYCALFDDMDFAERDWVDTSGWPLDPYSLERHYAEAATLLHVDDASFDPSEFPVVGSLACVSVGGIEAHIWRFGSRIARFGEEYVDELEFRRVLFRSRKSVV